MKKRLIYLQFGFWKKVKCSKDVEDKRLFWDLYGALECSNIRADIPLDEWDYENDELLFYLFQNSVDGYGTDIEKYVPEKFEDALDFNKEQTIENLCAVYLLDESTEKCKKYSSLLGVLCINTEMIKEHRYVRGEAVMYEKDEAYDKFEKCKIQFASPCNSMVIIDPYILMKKRSIDLNLIPLLNISLPPDLENKENQKVEFHLSILSQTNKCYMGKNREINYKDIYDYVYEEIRKIRPKLKMKFSLIHINTTGNGNGDFHSRHLLTNFMLVNSEDGFDFFENRKNEYTKQWETVSGKHARLEFVYPTLIDNRRLDAENYYRWIKLSACNPFNKSNLSWGDTDTENRLFELI